ncbi:MAG: hypothetical protein HKP58_00155 [Desulfatitalea sp.]|nr:hypothetical protein [Desulfatitalea sp.]
MKHNSAKNQWLVVVAMFFFFMLAVLPASSLAEGVTIVVNKEVPVESVSADDIHKIFLGKKTTWESGEKIIFAVWADSKTQAVFFREYVKKSPPQFKNYWKSMVFTGKGTMPSTFKSEEEVLEFVKSTKGAIAFVSEAEDKEVKKVKVEE